jgi:hypothetical protein
VIHSEIDPALVAPGIILPSLAIVQYEFDECVNYCFVRFILNVSEFSIFFNPIDQRDFLREVVSISRTFHALEMES